MTVPATRLLLAGLTGALLATLAWLAAAPPRRSNELSSATSALGRDLTELVRLQERTLATLERLAAAREDEIAEPYSPAVRTEVPAREPAPTTLDGLVQSLDALRGTLELESRRTHELLRAAPTALGGESLLKTRERRAETDWPALLRLEQSWRTDPVAADRSQYFQTARDLLETYGPPSAIYRPEGGLLFHYRRSPDQGGGPEWYFRLQDGFVVEFFVEDPEGK